MYVENRLSEPFRSKNYECILLNYDAVHTPAPISITVFTVISAVLCRFNLKNILSYVNLFAAL